jgi:hypothetical protein
LVFVAGQGPDDDQAKEPTRIAGGVAVFSLKAMNGLEKNMV